MSKRMKFALACLMVMSLILPGLSSRAADNRVVGHMQVLSEYDALVTLSWSDDSKTDPIRITGWTIGDDHTLIVDYQTSAKEIAGWDSRSIKSENGGFPMKLLLRQNGDMAAVFTDLPADSAKAGAILNLYNQGIISGYGDGTFKPEAPVTRAEMAKMILLSADYSLQSGTTSSFKDVTSVHWAKDYIMTLADKSILKGKSTGIFDPSGSVTLGEVAAILNRTFELYAAGSSYAATLKPHWSNDDFLALVDAGIIIPSDGFYKSYAPDAKATREVCARLISRILEQMHGVN